jgi:glycosyltransferase involved in cell wall biosynthesis
MISILIPAYEEAQSITDTIGRLRAVMDTTKISYEIIVIDDGSKDDTAKLAEEADARVIRHPTNGGYGRALKTGMLHAAYDWCAIVDADGSYPLERFPDLLANIPQFDMVVGARTGKHYWGPFTKRVGRQIILWLVSFVIGSRVPDINSGMRVFRKEVALAHIKRISSGYSFTTTLTLAMFLEERFVRFIPIDYFPREGKSKVRLWSDSLRMIQILAAATLFYNPLKLFLPLCFMSAGLGALLAIASELFGSPSGWLILALSLQVSILIGAIGFIAEAIRLHRISQ